MKFLQIAPRVNVKKALEKQSGFTLLEMAIAMSIFVFMAYSLAYSVQSADDYDLYQDNKSRLVDVREALLSFVQVNGYLPCPDSDVTADGIEDRDSSVSGSVCDSQFGYLPYKMLGVPQYDVFGNPYLYSINADADNAAAELANADINTVTENAAFFSTDLQEISNLGGFENRVVPRFNLMTGVSAETGNISVSGNLTICSESATTCSSSTSAANLLENGSALLVVVSFGMNGALTWSGIDADDIEGLSVTEQENANRDSRFWQASTTQEDDRFFDDQMTWLTANEVKYAMLKTERGLR